MIDGQGINICDRTASDHCDEYIELHASSAFSFLGGASEPESFVERAVELDMPAMALADRNGLYGAARFHTSAKLNKVKAHIGAEIAVSSFGKRLVPAEWLPHHYPDEPPRIVLLCASQVGYQNLCQLITRFKMRESTKAEGAATFDDLEEFSSGLICLTGGEEGPLAAALNGGGESWRAQHSIDSPQSMGTAMCMSNSSATINVKKNIAMPHCRTSLRSLAYRRSRPMARAVPHKTIVNSSTYLLRFAITRQSMMPDDFLQKLLVPSALRSGNVRSLSRYS